MAVFFQELFNPLQDDATWGKRLFNALLYNVAEDKPGSLYLMFEPFITPSLFIEAVIDVAPAMWTGRVGGDGKTKEGKIVFDIRNDPPGEILAKIFAHIFLDINPTTLKNAKQVMDAAEGHLSPSGKELNLTNQIMKMVLGLGVDEQDPIGGITFQINEFTKYFGKTQTDFKNDARDTQKLVEDPFLVEREFENLQANRYREMNRVYDFVMFLKHDLNLSNGEITKHGRTFFSSKLV